VHTSAIPSLIANVNRDPKKTRPFKPSDFDPYSAKEKREGALEVKDMDILKHAFLRGTMPIFAVSEPGANALICCCATPTSELRSCYDGTTGVSATLS
jgi:hypothetical protein